MCRTVGLARRGTGIIAVYLVVIPVIGTPLFRTPFFVVRKLTLGILNFTVFGTELLSEPYCTCGTDLNTFAAGNTFFPVHMGNICTS